MAKIERTKIKNYPYQVTDRMKVKKLFKNYRAALAYFLTL